MTPSAPAPFPEGPRLAGVVLAAGTSSRMGRCKLALPWPRPAGEESGGRGTGPNLSGDTPFGPPLEPLIAPVLRAALEAGLTPILAVIRPDACEELRAAIRNALRGLGPDRELLEAPLARQGQSESLKAAIRRLLEREADGQPPCAGAAVLLGDQPLVSSALLRPLILAFAPGGRAVAPFCRGRRGHPVLLPRAAFADLLQLRGNIGARNLLAAHGLRLVFTDDTAAVEDVDTPEDYERLARGVRSLLQEPSNRKDTA